MALVSKIQTILALAALAAGAYLSFNYGYDRAEAKYIAQMAASEKANNSAIAEAYESLEDELVQAKTEKEQLENAYAQVVQAARADVRAGECGVSADSVLRLNTVR